MAKDKKFPVGGKKPKKKDVRNLQMSNYIKKLVPLPSSIDHESRVPKPVPTFQNDIYNNCTIAAAGHMIRSWTTYADRGTLTIPDEKILSAYFTISPKDNGAYALDALNHWRKKGIDTQRIEGFVELRTGDITQAKQAVMYFGSAYVGLSLPDVNLYGPWTTVTGSPNIYNGHMVNICAYDDAKRMFKVMTWGEVWDMSYDWYQTYSDEGYAVLDNLSLKLSTGLTPQGFDWNTLLADINEFGTPVIETRINPDSVTPPPTPTPTPDPTPTPTPTPEPEKDSSKKYIFIAIGAAAFLGALVIALL